MTTLRKLAEGVTPGEWIREGLSIVVFRRGIIAKFPGPKEGGVFDVDANAAYIAAAHPAAILAMDDEMIALRTMLSALLVEYVAGRKEGHIDSFPATARKLIADAIALLPEDARAALGGSQ